MSSRNIDALRDSKGAFSMLAIDQRESLRAMLASAAGADVDTVADQALVDFKSAVARILSPAASAILLDREFGLEAATAASCPVILAADILSSSSPGGPIDRAEIDTGIDAAVVEQFDAGALKMLVPWRPETRAESIALGRDFMALCAELGMPGIVEGVVRPLDLDSWSLEDRRAAIVEAARDFATVEPDLYKGEVPPWQAGELGVVTEAARRITDVLDCPWVVLSSGVEPGDFPAAVEACREGGAEGFLAGRALWKDALFSPDPVHFLGTESLGRLRSLAAGRLPS